MSAFEVVHQYGAWALTRFVLALLAFLVLHLLRQPLLVTARLLEACMRRIDRFVVAGLPLRPAATGRWPAGGGGMAGGMTGGDGGW